VEINSGIFVCGGNSFLLEYRGSTNCPDKPLWMHALTAFGLLMTIVTALITVVLFRNYEFLEQNKLKRRYS
jgi:hypothetical protein